MVRTDVSRHRIHPMFKGQGVRTALPFKMGPTGRLKLKDGKTLSRNVANQLPAYAAQYPKTTKPQLRSGGSFRSLKYLPRFENILKICLNSTITLFIKLTSDTEFILNSLFPSPQTAIHLYNPSLKVICKTQFIL